MPGSPEGQAVPVTLWYKAEATLKTETPAAMTQGRPPNGLFSC